MKEDYKPVSGQDAVKRLNELGYPISAKDGAHEGLLGMIVALAEEIEALKRQTQSAKP